MIDREKEFQKWVDIPQDVANDIIHIANGAFIVATDDFRRCWNASADLYEKEIKEKDIIIAGLMKKVQILKNRSCEYCKNKNERDYCNYCSMNDQWEMEE